MSSQEYERKGGGETGAAQAPMSANYLQPNGASGTDLSRQLSVTLTPQQFEELYLQPSLKSRQQGELIKALGNPTALGIICFIFNLLPTSTILMGWRGQTAMGQLGLQGVYYFVGGLGMVLAGTLEFIIGNTFPFVVFVTFGLFWLSLAVFLDPAHGVAVGLGQDATDLYGPFAFYLLTWSIYVFMLTVASFRTNAVLVWILFFVALTFVLLSAAYFHLADASAAMGATLLKAAGAMGFAACMGGLYILFHLLLASTQFPFNLPLGDLSGFLRPKKRE
ncbi:unnamed protein product [Parajaminaea phylloscopi]